VDLQAKYNSLQQILEKLGKVVVAYSGGVDSTLLLKVAIDTLGSQNVQACIAAGPSWPEAEYRRAIETAETIGADVRAIWPNELADPAYSANNADRCFHCKLHLFGILSDIAGEKGFACVVCGGNCDDEKDYRPGSRAAKVFGVRSPLAEAEFTKHDIRRLSRQLNLPTADIAASACLATRISYGLQITEERLNQIEQAEDFLRALGLAEVRVRLHDTIARIEVYPRDIEKMITEPTRAQIVEKLKTLGFNYVTIDLQGFRSGSMNELLTEEQKQKNR